MYYILLKNYKYFVSGFNRLEKYYILVKAKF